MDLFNSTPNSIAADNDNGVDYSRIGRYAEFLVCADITKNGHHAIHTDTTGFDVMMVCGHKTYRVQVKSSSVIKGGSAEWRCRINKDSSRGNNARKREVDRRDADILALYHHDLETITYVPVARGCGQLSLNVRQVKLTSTSVSLQNAIEQCDATPILYSVEGMPA